MEISDSNGFEGFAPRSRGLCCQSCILAPSCFGSASWWPVQKWLARSRKCRCQMNVWRPLKVFFVGFLHTAKLRRSSNGANVKSDLPFDRNSMAMRPNCQPSRLSLHPHLERVLLGKEGGQNPPDLDPHHSSTQSLSQLEDLYMVDFDPQKCCIVLG